MLTIHQPAQRLDALMAELESLRRSHVDCDNCNRRLERIKIEVAQLRGQPEVDDCAICGEPTSNNNGAGMFCCRSCLPF